MKKSQILAALALAFSLGVVAPVAGANAEEGIMPLDVNEDNGTTTVCTEATAPELAAVITSIKKDSTYNAYSLVADAFAEANTAFATGVKPLDFNNTTSEFGKLVSALRALNISTTATGTTLSQAQFLSGEAEKVANYAEWATLIDRVAEADGLSATATAAQQAAAATNLVSALNDIPGVTATTNGETYTSLSTKAKNLTNYTKMENLIKANINVKKAISLTEQMNTALNAYANAMPSYNAATIAAKNAVIAGIKADYEGTTPFFSLKRRSFTLVNNAAWTTLSRHIASFEEKDLEGDYTKTGRCTQIIALRAEFETLTGYALEESKPVQTPNNPDEPGTDQPGTETPGDDTKDPSAPGTGLVSTAEGNAATTVSIVAGLATALTALGAGVVAYRSARRSNK